jgi:hypothetical protein
MFVDREVVYAVLGRAVVIPGLGFRLASCEEGVLFDAL